MVETLEFSVLISKFSKYHIGGIKQTKYFLFIATQLFALISKYQEIALDPVLPIKTKKTPNFLKAFSLLLWTLLD